VHGVHREAIEEFLFFDLTILGKPAKPSALQHPAVTAPLCALGEYPLTYLEGPWINVENREIGERARFRVEERVVVQLATGSHHQFPRWITIRLRRVTFNHVVILVLLSVRPGKHVVLKDVHHS